MVSRPLVAEGASGMGAGAREEPVRQTVSVELMKWSESIAT